MNKNKKYLIIIFVLVLAAAVAYFVLLKLDFFSPKIQSVACTMEARLCPDGSYVGRSGPNCEFTPCPAKTESGWKTFTDAKQGIAFQYPERLTTRFIFTNDWPPKVTISAGNFSCVETSATASQPERIMQRMVDNRVYCQRATSGAAAGTVYTQYVYTTARGDKLVSLDFTLAYPQCLNYDEPNQSDCTKEREAFDLDAVVDRMVNSLKFK